MISFVATLSSYAHTARRKELGKPILIASQEHLGGHQKR
jgi:hypothetical protein